MHPSLPDQQRGVKRHPSPQPSVCGQLRQRENGRVGQAPDQRVKILIRISPPVIAAISLCGIIGATGAEKRTSIEFRRQFQFSTRPLRNRRKNGSTPDEIGGGNFRNRLSHQRRRLFVTIQRILRFVPDGDIEESGAASRSPLAGDNAVGEPGKIPGRRFYCIGRRNRIPPSCGLKQKFRQRNRVEEAQVAQPFQTADHIEIQHEQQCRQHRGNRQNPDCEPHLCPAPQPVEIGAKQSRADLFRHPETAHGTSFALLRRKPLQSQLGVFFLQMGTQLLRNLLPQGPVLPERIGTAPDDFLDRRCHMHLLRWRRATSSALRQTVWPPPPFPASPRFPAG